MVATVMVAIVATIPQKNVATIPMRYASQFMINISRGIKCKQIKNITTAQHNIMANQMEEYRILGINNSERDSF